MLSARKRSAYSRTGDLEVWSRPLKGGEYAIGLFNRGTAAGQDHRALARCRHPRQLQAARCVEARIACGNANKEYTAEFPRTEWFC